MAKLIQVRLVCEPQVGRERRDIEEFYRYGDFDFAGPDSESHQEDMRIDLHVRVLYHGHLQGIRDGDGGLASRRRRSLSCW